MVVTITVWAQEKRFDFDGVTYKSMPSGWLGVFEAGQLVAEFFGTWAIKIHYEVKRDGK